MFFSIVIPAYNVQNYLKRCVDSVLKQDFYDYDIILIDDGSTDLSGTICDSYKSAHPNVIVIHQPNGGLSKARNVGIDKSHGNYIIFLDSDDWLFEGSLTRIYNQILNSGGIDLFIGRSKSINDKGETLDKINYRIKTGLYDVDAYLKRIERPNRYTACAPFSIYNRAFLLASGLRFKEGIIHEDELWTPSVLLKAKKVFVSDIYFYYHYHRENSINLSKDWDKHGENYYIVVKELAELFKPLKKGYARRLREQMVILYLQAFCFMNNRTHMDFKPKFLFSNSYSFKTVLKVLLFTLSSDLYVKLYNRMSGYS